MADPAEFSPIELDRIEDALETIELAESHDEPSIAVRRRLTDYRKILDLSRAAMPMVEVPRGLLDSVLAEARAAAELPVMAPAASEPAPASVWTRLRRALLLPGVALATTAALVLLIVERSDKSPESPAVAGAQQVASNADDQRARGPVADKVVSETRAEDGRAQAQDAPPPPPEPAPAAGVVAPGGAAGSPAVSTPVEAAKTDEPLDRSKLENADAREYAEKKKADAPAAAQPATVVDQETTPRWDIIARGDRARHKGDCGGARSEYTLALDDLDARVRARAHAGLGLCSVADGDRPAADAAYKQARELDAEIVGFIEAERPRGAGSSNASKAAKKPKAAPAQTNQAVESDERALDPFGE